MTHHEEREEYGDSLTRSESPILVLALGNDLLGDDGVGPWAARALRGEFGSRVDVIETGEAGLALMELMEGYERVLILDAIMTGDVEPGTVLTFGPDDFRRVVAPSPHYAGLPEVLELARRLQIAFPSDIRVLALEVQNPFAFGESFTPRVEQAMPTYIDRARQTVIEWVSPVFAGEPARSH